MQRSLKRQLVFGLAALAVVAFAGGAYAATQSSTSTSRQAFLDDVAKRLGVTPQQLTAALSGATLDQLQAAVTAGQLTQAQANALQQRLKQNGNVPVLPFGYGYGVGPRFAHPPIPGGPGFGGGRGFGGGLGGHVGGILSLPTAASYLGLTDAQLFQQLRSGKSLAQIATAKGKTVSGLEQAMTSAMKTRLDKLVASKAITSAQEKQILNRFSAGVAKIVSQKGTPFPRPLLRFKGAPSFKGAPPGMPTPGRAPNMPVPPAYVPPAYAPPPGAPAPTA